MRNIRFCYVVIFFVLLILNMSCSRSTPNALQIVSVNDNQPLIVDVKDWYLWVNPEDPEETLSTYATKDWIVPIKVTYTETGIGLPTYPTPYTARITNYKVKFEGKVRIGGVDITWRPSQVSGATNILVPSDPQGGSTVTAQLNVVPNVWIEANMDTLELGTMMNATLILTGKEELNDNDVADTSYFTINFADYYDDPNIINQ